MQSSAAARLLPACSPRASELQLCSGEVDDGARDVIAPSWHHPVPGLGFGSLALTQAQSLTNANANPNPNLSPSPNPNRNPEQAQCWPPLIAGRDTIGVAKTGSGKTLAFFLPLLEKLLGKKRSGVRVLILAPTRELAMQSEEVCKAAGGACGVGSVCIYGGLT